LLVPLLGTGLMQAVSCQGAVRASAAVNGNQCLGTGGANPLTAFRIGSDGLTAPLPTAAATLAQPYFAGVGGNATAGDGSALDPKFKPNHSDSFDFTIQRELVPRNVILEVGYIGRRIRDEYQAIDLDAVPYMTTLGGQTFAGAFATVYTALAAGQAPQTQAWFESALGGANSAYCTGFASCTAAVASSRLQHPVDSRLQPLGKSRSRTMDPGRTLPTRSTGWLRRWFVVCQQRPRSSWNGPRCNYNAAFVAFEFRDWHA
jgi:hypothetical protein